MGALKQPIFHGLETAVRKARREIPPADYDDEITDAQIQEMRKQVAAELESDEWEIVDGPAW